MFFSGIADEAGRSLERQIAAHNALGWNHIDLRRVDGTEFSDCSDDMFEASVKALDAAGMTVSCIASPIGAGRTHISGDFEPEVERLDRCISRMQRLNSPFIRVMTWPGNDVDEDTWGQEAVRRMKTLAGMAEKGGITLLLENCSGWASISPDHYTRFFEMVDSPALKSVYDTGNPASKGSDYTWQWYQAAKPHIGYIHIKCHTGPLDDASQRGHTWPEEGASLIQQTLEDQFRNGYDGGIAIEPHLGSRLRPTPETTDEESAWLTYVEYGRRLMTMVEAAGGKTD